MAELAHNIYQLTKNIWQIQPFNDDRKLGISFKPLFTFPHNQGQLNASIDWLPSLNGVRTLIPKSVSIELEPSHGSVPFEWDLTKKTLAISGRKRLPRDDNPINLSGDVGLFIDLEGKTTVNYQSGTPEFGVELEPVLQIDWCDDCTKLLESMFGPTTSKKFSTAKEFSLGKIKVPNDLIEAYQFWRSF